MKRYLSTFLVIIMLGCHIQKVDKTLLEGNWYFFKKDGHYTELSIVDSLIYWHTDFAGPFGPFTYIIEKDTLKMQYLLTGEMYSYSPKLTLYNDDSILFSFKDENIILYRLRDTVLTLNEVILNNNFEKYERALFRRMLYYSDKDTAEFYIIDDSIETIYPKTDTDH